jgi:hypothetical protein
MKSPSVAAVPLSTASVALPFSDRSTHEQRWAAWQAKGAAHDRSVRFKMAIAAPIVALVFLALFYTLMIG